jgi:hypothetical protein
MAGTATVLQLNQRKVRPKGFVAFLATLQFVDSRRFSFFVCRPTQNKETSGDDASAVHSTVTNYIEAFYTGNAARMEQTHPHYLKHKIHGNIPVREQTGADLVQAARSREGTHLTKAERTERVTVLDVAGNIASAKLVTPGWPDYMTLTRIDGQWKILYVVQRFDD